MSNLNNARWSDTFCALILGRTSDDVIFRNYGFLKEVPVKNVVMAHMGF